MPLKISLDTARSPYYRIRGTVCGTRIDRSSGTTKRAEAQQLAERLATEIRESYVAGQSSKSKKAKAFSNAVLEYLTDPQNPGRDKRFVNELLSYFMTTPCDEIGQEQLDAFIRERYPGAAPATITRQALVPLRAVLRHAGYFPVFKSSKPRPTKLRFLTYEESQRLLTNAAPHLQPLIVFLLHTGARLGEALALDWNDVDLSRQRVTFHDTKNGETRSTYLSDEALEWLASIEYPTGRLGPDGKPEKVAERTGRVFRTPQGENYSVDRGFGGHIKTAWAGACRRAKIDGTSPHTLRHTFASWHVMAGTPLRTVAELLGHKGLAMVMRYSHLSADHLAAAQERVFGRKKEPDLALVQNTGISPDAI